MCSSDLSVPSTTCQPPSPCITRVQDAHTAFQAVAVAAKALQDAGARSALDAAREDRRLRQMAERAAAAEEQARQWRVARGEEAPGVSCVNWYITAAASSTMPHLSGFTSA